MSCIDVVIVNWNSGELLKRAVNSIFAANHTAVRSVIVVDNASDDGSANGLASNPQIDVVSSEVNLGFAAACNLGAARGRSNYILFLNPDAEVGQETLACAVEYMERSKNDSVAACGVRLLDRCGQVQRHCARFPTWRTFVGASTGLDRLLPSVFPPLHMRNFDHLDSRTVDHVIGAFYLVRRSVFNQIGGFDEQFFMYLEDLDLSLRIKRAGFKIVYRADVIAHHMGGGTTRKILAERLSYVLRSRLRYSAKHFSQIDQAIVFVSIMLFELPIRLIREVLAGRWSGSIAVLKGYQLFMRGLINAVR